MRCLQPEKKVKILNGNDRNKHLCQNEISRIAPFHCKSETVLSLLQSGSCAKITEIQACFKLLRATRLKLLGAESLSKQKPSWLSGSGWQKKYCRKVVTLGWKLDFTDIRFPGLAVIMHRQQCRKKPASRTWNVIYQLLLKTLIHRTCCFGPMILISRPSLILGLH